MKDSQKIRIDTRVQKRGFTLLIASVVSAIVMTLGVAVVASVKQQLVLSGVAHESEIAFYAADAALECMQDLDGRGVFDVPRMQSSSINCFGIQATIPAAQSGSSQSAQFSWTMGDREVCSKIDVYKRIVGGTNVQSAEMHAYGYNTSCANITSKSDVVERAILYTY